MATYTTNMNLKKPAGSENMLISDINGNMDIIDGLFKGMAVFTADFTARNPGSINGIISFPNNSGRYLVFFWYNGYTFANSMSVYFMQRGQTGDIYGVQQIAKGSEGRTVTMTTEGIVSKGEANDYNVRCCVLRLTK